MTHQHKMNTIPCNNSGDDFKIKLTPFRALSMLPSKSIGGADMDRCSMVSGVVFDTVYVVVRYEKAVASLPFSLER